MNASDLYRVVGIAKDTRRWAEIVAEVEAFDEELNGLCARASARLFSNLINAGYQPQLILSVNHNVAHVWVKLMDHIVDITASQFKHPDVCIIRCRISRPWYWRETACFESPSHLRIYQMNEDWPKNQTVKRKELTCV